MYDERKHLTGREIEKMLAAVKGARNEARDRCLLLMLFRHGLRVSEALALKLNAVDPDGRSLHVTRLKKGLSTTHPLRGDELRLLRVWLKVRATMNPETNALFISERRGVLSRKTVWALVKRYGEAADPDIAAHPHMLRHACGFALADQGGGYAADTGLPETSEHPAYGTLYRDQSGTV